MREESKTHIPYFEEINDFLAATKVPDRTNDPLFYCMRLQKHENRIFMPPFKRGFYFVGLINVQDETSVTYNEKREVILDSFIVFQAPDLLYSFYASPGTSGYLIYFKEACFEFFKPDIQKEFPFFNILNTALFHLERSKYHRLADRFERGFQNFGNGSSRSQNRINTLTLLALLYELLAFPDIADPLMLDNQIKKHLVTQYIQQVNVHYLEKRTVGEYAGALAISEDHLSRVIKAETGRTAYSYIVDRTIKEAKTLIAFTEMTFSEIAYRLNFSDTSNFSKYFKRATGSSPTEYRQTRIDR